MKPTARLRRILAIAGSSLLTVSSSHAADGTWNVDADGLWSSAGNWTPGIADGSGSTANFTNDITSDRTVSLDSARTLTGLVFGDSDTATAGSWILNNNATPANVLTLAGTTPGITVNALGTGKTATISAIIGGTAGLVKNGTGTLVLSGANTYTGTTTISAGTLRLQGAAPLNTGRTYTINGGAVMNLNGGATFNTSVAGSSTINGTGTLRLSGGSYARSAAGGGTLTLALGAGGLIDIQSTAGVSTWYGSVVSFTGNQATLNVDGTIDGNNALTIQADALTGAGTISNSSTTLNIGVNNGSGTFSGSIQSTSSLTKTGTGTQTLSGNNSYTGTTTVNGGTLRLDMTGSGVLSASSALTLGGGEFNVKGKTSGATTQTLGSFTMNSGNNRISLDPNGGTSTILTLGNAWTRNVGSSMLIDYSSANSGTREVRTAAATTTYALSNGIYGGILVKDSAGAIGFATRAAGSNVAITRYDDTTGTTLADNSNAAATNFTTLNTTYTSGTLNWSNGITTRSVNSLTIDTTNNGGTIDMGASTNVLTLTSQGILFKGSNNSILQGGTVGASGSEVIVHQTSGTNTLTISSLISGGAGSLTKNGIGTLIVSGANTYTGTTTINAGELRLSGGAFTTTAGRTYQIGTGAVMSFGASGAIPSGTNTTIQGNGTLRVLNGVNINAGGTGRKINMNLGAGAVIDVQAGGSFGNGYQPIVWTSNLATLNMDGTHDFWDDNGIIAAALTGSGTIASTATSGANPSLTLGVNNGSGTFSGNITATGDRTVSLIKNGTGTQVFSGSTTFKGTTTINGGTLQYAKTSSLQAGATGDWVKTKITVNNGGTIAFNVGGTNEFTTGNVTTLLAGLGGTVTNNGLVAGSTIAFDTTNASGGSFTIADAIANTSGTGGGAVGLRKIGTNTLVLTNTNTYSGPTTISGGTLAVTGTGSINNSAVTVNGGTFRYNSSVAYSGALTFTSGTIAGTNLTGSLGGQIIGANQMISPGNSPGTMATTDQTWAGGGSYLWEINKAAGTAGADPGWDLETGTGTLTISATSGSKFNLNLYSLLLAPADTQGALDGFSNSSNYNWLLADFANPVVGFAANAFNIVDTNFVNNNSINGNFAVALGNTVGGDNTQLYLTYTAIPEPRTALLGGLGLLALLRRRRN